MDQKKIKVINAGDVVRFEPEWFDTKDEARARAAELNAQYGFKVAVLLHVTFGIFA